MLAGLLIGAAFAADPTGARPGAGAPELVWTPVFELRAGLDGTGTDGVSTDFGWSTRTRIGLQLDRKVLTARASVAAGLGGPALPDVDATSARTYLTLGEAWARYSLPLSSAMGLDATVGRQLVDVDDGVLLGDDDHRLLARLPVALRVHVRAAPWDVDWFSGLYPDFPGAPTSTATGYAFHALRVGAGRENPAWTWHLSGLGLLTDSTGVDPLRAEPLRATVGLRGDTDLDRVRLRADAWTQPGTDGLAWMAGGQGGYALGDDARVELALRFDVLSGGEDPQFHRPLADTQSRFGWLGWFDEGAAPTADGVTDVALVCDAVIAPQLRFSAAAHHFWLGGGVPYAPELDGDLRWYWSPLAALHLRGAAMRGWAGTDGWAIDTEASVDVHF